MAKDLFEFSCPCCGKRVELDVRSGRVRAVRPEEAKGGKDLDRLVADHRRESERLGNLFADAADQQRRQGERLDELLREAKREAAKDDPERDRPRSPFDLE